MNTTVDLKGNNKNLEESSKHIISQIKKVCKNFGPRESGSEAENKAQDNFAKEMAEYADEIKTEKFTISPHAFMGWVLVCGMLMIASSAFFIASCTLVTAKLTIIFKAVSLALSVVTLFLIIGEFVLYKQILDPFCKKSESSNVICTKKATVETRRKIIFSGHMDSAYEWSFSKLGGPVLLKTVVIPVLVFVVVALVLDIVAIATSSNAKWMIIVQAIAVIWYIAVLFFVNWKETVMGANDDLTGVYITAEVLKYMYDNNLSFEYTDVTVISVGSEEAGLRGTKDFMNKHKNEFKNIETVCVIFDTICQEEYFVANVRDMTCTVKLDERAVKLVKSAGEKVGCSLPSGVVSLGSTDAAACAQAGIPAVSITAMDASPAQYYHTRLDTEALLNQSAIKKGFAICLETLFEFDKNGLAK